MSYQKHNFQTGDTLFAAQLNAMENQIYSNEQAIADLLYEPIAVSAFSASPNKAEKGSTVNSVTLTYTINKVPVTATLDNEAVVIEEAHGTIEQSGLAQTSNKTWTLAVEDEREGTATKTATLSFMNRVYYGAAASGTINSAFILNLANSALSNTKNQTFTVTAGAGEYIWYAVPSSMGNCSFKVGGFDGGFTKVQTVSHTNASGYTEDYDVYRSDNPSLGSTAVTVS